MKQFRKHISKYYRALPSGQIASNERANFLDHNYQSIQAPADTTFLGTLTQSPTSSPVRLSESHRRSSLVLIRITPRLYSTSC